MDGKSAYSPEVQHRRVLRAEIRNTFQPFRISAAKFEAEKQTVTKELQAILEEGRTVATFLRAGLKQSLGERNEKLTQFGIRPFRGRSRRKAAADPSS